MMDELYTHESSSALSSAPAPTNQPGVKFRASSVAVFSLCNERRRRHLINAAGVEVLHASFIHEFHDDPIDTTRVAQSIHAMPGFRDDHVPAVWQIFCDFLAALWWRDRVDVTGEDQH